jgi:hypothetical protein
MRSAFAAVLLPCIAIAIPVAAGDKKEPDKKPEKESHLLVVPPSGGKAVKLSDWRFAAGTRFLDLTGAASKPKTKSGVEYLEFREEKSTTYKNGIFTYIALTSLGKLAYDHDKKTVAATVIKDDGNETTIYGSTKFAGNKLTIEAEAILDGLGAATVKYQGGIDKGVRSITFPTLKPAEKVKGPTGVVTADDKEKTKHIVNDLQPVWLVDGQYRIVPYVLFKKTVKIDMEKLVGMRFSPPVDKKGSSEYEVTLKDDVKHTLSILLTAEYEKKKTMTFVGFIGRVPVGYKLFMLDAVYEYRAGEPKEKIEI